MNETEGALRGIWLQKLADSNIPFQPTTVLPIYEVIVVKHEITDELLMVPRLRQKKDEGMFTGDMLFYNANKIQEYVLCFSGPLHWCQNLLPSATLEGEEGWLKFQQETFGNYLNVLLTMTIVVSDEIPFYIQADFNDTLFENAMNDIVGHLLNVTVEYGVIDLQAQKFIVSLILSGTFAFFGLEVPIGHLEEAFAFNSSIEPEETVNPNIDPDFWQTELSDILHEASDDAVNAED